MKTIKCNDCGFIDLYFLYGAMGNDIDKCPYCRSDDWKEITHEKAKAETLKLLSR